MQLDKGLTRAKAITMASEEITDKQQQTDLRALSANSRYGCFLRGGNRTNLRTRIRHRDSPKTGSAINLWRTKPDTEYVENVESHPLTQ